MRTYLFESMADPLSSPSNVGAYLVAVPDAEERSWHSHLDPVVTPLLEQLGYSAGGAWVMDLLTREGAWFSMEDDARAELDRHRIHATAPFEAFLEWLYLQDMTQLYKLPHVVKVADATFSIKNYRRLGPHPISFTLRKGDTLDILWAGEHHIVACDGITEEGAVIRSLTEGERAELLGILTALTAAPEVLDDTRDDVAVPGIAVIPLPAGEDETAVLPAVDDTAEIPAAGDDTEAIPPELLE
jgi:hypothetical protein